MCFWLSAGGVGVPYRAAVSDCVSLSGAVCRETLTLTDERLPFDARWVRSFSPGEPAVSDCPSPLQHVVRLCWRCAAVLADAGASAQDPWEAQDDLEVMALRTESLTICRLCNTLIQRETS